MKLKGMLLFLCAVLGACGKQAQELPAMTRHTLAHAGLEREYFVFRPSTYTSNAGLPAVVFLHGHGGTATGTEAEVTQGLNRYAERAGYIVIYPQGSWFMANEGTPDQLISTSWNHISDGFDKGPDGPICTDDAVKYECPPECGTCGECGWASCNDDTGFLRSLVTTVRDEYSIDYQRVFVAGFSNGAMMAQRVACEASELFAGAFLAHGRVEPGFECTPTRPLPLLQVYGGNDRVVPGDGAASSTGYFYSTPQRVADHWLDGADCAADGGLWSVPGIDGENVQCSVRCGESAGPAIECYWSDGDHRWPGTAGKIGSNGYCATELQLAGMPGQTPCIAPDPDADIWGSTLMFEFFSSHSE